MNVKQVPTDVLGRQITYKNSFYYFNHRGSHRTTFPQGPLLFRKIQQESQAFMTNLGEIYQSNWCYENPQPKKSLPCPYSKLDNSPKECSRDSALMKVRWSIIQNDTDSSSSNTESNPATIFKTILWLRQSSKGSEHLTQWIWFRAQNIDLCVLSFDTKKYCIGVTIHELHVTKAMYLKIWGAWLLARKIPFRETHKML